MEELTTVIFSRDVNNISDNNGSSNCASFTKNSETQSSNVKSGLFLCPLWQTDIAIACVYCVFTSVIIVVGTFGNVYIIWASFHKKSKRGASTVFTVFLSSGNLCISCIAEPLCLVGAIYGEEWFYNHYFICEAVACMCFTACIGTYFTLILHILDRYLFICQNIMYTEFVSPLKAGVVCFTFWLGGFLFDTGNFFGWNEHTFDHKTHRCMWSRHKSFSYKMTLAGLLGLPFVIAAASFFLIFRKIYVRKRDVYKFSHLSKNRNKRAFKDAIGTSRRLLYNLITFIVCWAPAGSIVFIDLANKVVMEVYLFSIMLAHFHTCMDFFISLRFNRISRASMKRLDHTTERTISITMKKAETRG